MKLSYLLLFCRVVLIVSPTKLPFVAGLVKAFQQCTCLFFTFKIEV